jgi:hypothetical protein
MCLSHGLKIKDHVSRSFALMNADRGFLAANQPEPREMLARHHSGTSNLRGVSKRLKRAKSKKRKIRHELMEKSYP